MAVVKNNLVVDGLSGKLGKNIVFRQRNGKTIVSSRPVHSQTKTEKQENHRIRFTKAVRYAQVQMADPVYGEKYRSAAKAKGISTPNNLAIRDFLRPPVIENLDIGGYHGDIGDKILVEAFDDLEVEKVAVEIYHDDGSLVEKGFASKNGTEFEWHYASTVANTEFNGDRILVKAIDHPGNETSMEIFLS